jgi:hypothetical protein
MYLKILIIETADPEMNYIPINRIIIPNACFEKIRREKTS